MSVDYKPTQQNFNWKHLSFVCKHMLKIRAPPDKFRVSGAIISYNDCLRWFVCLCVCYSGDFSEIIISTLTISHIVVTYTCARIEAY